jgi:hypothetical protein
MTRNAGKHKRLPNTVRFKDWVPPKYRVASSGNDLSICSAFKEDGVKTWQYGPGVSDITESYLSSSPGPAEYANVQRAHAAVVWKPVSKSLSPWCPSPSRKYLMYGPGKPLSAAKQSAVSSVMQALCVFVEAIMTKCTEFQNEPNQKYLFSSCPTFCEGNLLCGSLDFRNCDT